jgi:hypothetical protein
MPYLPNVQVGTEVNQQNAAWKIHSLVVWLILAHLYIVARAFGQWDALTAILPSFWEF